MNIFFIASRKMSTNLNVRAIFKDSINKLNQMISRLDTQLGVNSFQNSNNSINNNNDNNLIDINIEKQNSEIENKKNIKNTKKQNALNNTDLKEEIKKAAKPTQENKGNNNKNKDDEEKDAKIKLYSDCDLRVGKVLDLKYMENSEDIYRLKIDLGEEQPREIGTGLRKYVNEEQLLNKKVIVFANLKPKKLGGKYLSKFF